LQGGTFGTCLNCIDGRVQQPVIQWVRDHYDIDYADMITEAGMDGFLADPQSDITSVLGKIRVSVEKHQSKIIFLVGHLGCAGNPVNPVPHKRHIRFGINRLKSYFPGIRIIGLWISDKGHVAQTVE